MRRTNWLDCLRVANTLGPTGATLVATAKELEDATDAAAREAAVALREAQEALLRAQGAVKAAANRRLVPLARAA